LRKIETPRLRVIKKWFKQVQGGLKCLHDYNIVHGKLTCESIYINSNKGEIKIGDIGIKYVYASEQELGQRKWYLKEQDTKKFDVYCFGLALLETISTKVST